VVRLVLRVRRVPLVHRDLRVILVPRAQLVPMALRVHRDLRVILAHRVHKAFQVRAALVQWVHRVRLALRVRLVLKVLKVNVETTEPRVRLALRDQLVQTEAHSRWSPQRFTAQTMVMLFMLVDSVFNGDRCENILVVNDPEILRSK
jgi:hypothetical protein